MATEYEDPVNRTIRLYGKELKKAESELGVENPGMKHSFDYELLLEAKLRELTGDPKARLVRTIEDNKILIEIAFAQAKTEYNMEKGRMN